MTVSAVGFVGLGTMGNPMVRRLLGAGFTVVVTDVRQEAAEPLIALGAAWEPTVAAVAKQCRVVLTSLPGPAEIDAVVLGADGLLSGAERGDIHVDLSTSSLAAVRRLADAEENAGVTYMDAPVSGGAFFAEEGKLTVMVSGPASALERVQPVLAPIGNRVFHLGGEAGAGTVAKLVNNAIFLSAGLAAQEGVVLAAKAGLDVRRLVEVLEASSAAMYTGMLPMTLARDFENAFFTLRLAAKDLGLALESATELGVETPIAAAAHTVYRDGEAAGLGGEVFYATLKVFEAAAGTEVPPLD